MRKRPEWFDDATTRVLRDADGFAAAAGPRELDDAVAAGVGGPVYDALYGDSPYMRVEEWLAELIPAAGQRAVGGIGDGTWRGPLYLLYGLLAHVDRHEAARIRARADKVRAKLSHEDTDTLPDWLTATGEVTPTGQAWLLRDIYGGRFGVVAAFAYAGGRDPHVFAFDIDACGIAEVIGGGTHDDLDAAAAAWRDQVGTAGAGAQPGEIREPDDLAVLAATRHHLSAGFTGSETRMVVDNWFRTERRRVALLDAYARRGMAPAERTYRPSGADVDALTKEFAGWYADTHGTAIDPVDAVGLAEEWLEGQVSGTERVASPHRADVLRTLIGDWVDDDPVTVAARSLLPDWMRWRGELAGYPAALIARAVAVASGSRLPPDECPGADHDRG